MPNLISFTYLIICDVFPGINAVNELVVDFPDEISVKYCIWKNFIEGKT